MTKKKYQRIFLPNRLKYIEILAIEKGYVMARYPRCYPFVESIKEFEETFGKLPT